MWEFNLKISQNTEQKFMVIGIATRLQIKLWWMLDFKLILIVSLL